MIHFCKMPKDSYQKMKLNKYRIHKEFKKISSIANQGLKFQLFDFQYKTDRF